MSDGEYTGVLDRFERDENGEELAVLVLEREQQSIDEIAVPVTDLPDEARHVDAVVRARVVAGNLVDVTYDPDETRSRSTTAQERFDRLAERPGDSED